MEGSNKPMLYDDECKHDFIHTETIYTDNYEGGRMTYIRIDRFYCKYCLKERQIKKEELAYEKPEWYRITDR